MNKQSYYGNLQILLNDIRSKKNVVVIGKGPTATWQLARKPDTFYVGLKQGILFLKDIGIDLFVLTDFSGFYGIEYLIKDIRYILCPYFLHSWEETARRDLNYRYIAEYVKNLGFTGILCFAQIYSDFEMDVKQPVYTVANSGDYFFAVCQCALSGKNITTFGINRGVGYNIYIIELIKQLKLDTPDKKEWVAKFLGLLETKNSGQMHNIRFNKMVNQVYNNKYSQLKINHI